MLVGQTSCTSRLSTFSARFTCLKEWNIVAKSDFTNSILQGFYKWDLNVLAFSSYKIMWKFSMIDENGILAVKVYLLWRDYGHGSQTHYYNYVQNELI